MNRLEDNLREAFLAADEMIDWREARIAHAAAELRADDDDPLTIAERCYEFVRDEIRHSGDHQIDQPTCRASEVLEHRAGWCFAKSHLLAALLRANGIPAGLCYQRLSTGGGEARYCLHGLNVVYLPETGWYRVDPRGNKAGVDAAFTPPREQLAFTLTDAGERDLPEIWPTPHPAVVRCLTENKTCLAVTRNLPDIQVLPSV